MMASSDIKKIPTITEKDSLAPGAFMIYIKSPSGKNIVDPFMLVAGLLKETKEALLKQIAISATKDMGILASLGNYLNTDEKQSK